MERAGFNAARSAGAGGRHAHVRYRRLSIRKRCLLRRDKRALVTSPEKDRHRQLQITERLIVKAHPALSILLLKMPDARRQRLVGAISLPIRSIISDACSRFRGHLNNLPPTPTGLLRRQLSSFGIRADKA